MISRVDEPMDLPDWKELISSPSSPSSPFHSVGPGVVKASRVTEELYVAITKNAIKEVYDKIAQGADVNFVFGKAYSCPQGYTLLMTAAHRGHLEIARALLRAGADPNFMNEGGDLTIFWAIDGGPEMIKLLRDFGCDLNRRSPKDWTPLSYAKAKGKYGATEDKGIYPEDVLRFYGAHEVGSAPAVLGIRSPRESFNPEADGFMRERGNYKNVYAHP